MCSFSQVDVLCHQWSEVAVCGVVDLSCGMLFGDGFLVLVCDGWLGRVSL